MEMSRKVSERKRNNSLNLGKASSDSVAAIQEKTIKEDLLKKQN